MTARMRVLLYSSFALALGIILLFMAGSEQTVKATTWNAVYTTSISNSAAFAQADANALYNQGTGNANFGLVVNPTAPVGFQPYTDFQLPDGAYVGFIDSTSTLGFINGPCATTVLLRFFFMDGTTDTTHTADFKGTGDDLVRDDDLDGNVEAEDSNGVPTYADHYPSFLNQIFDPDGAATAKKPLRPRARYVSHLQVLAGAPVTQLEFVVFNPGDLGDAAKGLAGAAAAMEESFGYPLFVVLNNPTAGAAPSTITDFCTPLSTNTTLRGATRGLLAVKNSTSPPWEEDGFNQFCRDGNSLAKLLGNDNDADTLTDDGCLYVPDPCVDVDYGKTAAVLVAEGEDPAPATDDDGDTTIDEGCNLSRGENPAPLTGVYGTGTHLVHSYSQSLRDADNDGVDNGFDTCPTNANTGTDSDNDGLDSACDPNDGSASAAAPAPNGVDNDGDTNIDEDPVDNNDNDADTKIDEDGECKSTSGVPDQDQDCYNNRGDNCALTVNNQSDLDASPATADKGTTTDSIGDACEAGGNAPVAETPAQCNNQLDEDADTFFNDGCAQSGTRQEIGPECLDRGIDSDGDTVRNDGCPAAGGGAANGHYHSNSPTAAVCIPDPDGADDTDGNANSDNDGDGWCDLTEDLLGSNKGSAASTPEYLGLEYTGLPASAVDVSPQVCNDQASYPAGAATDNDADGSANAADNDCNPANFPGDTDKDGVGDTSDNCMSDDNPEQQDSDGDGAGDDCDADEDGDGLDNLVESGMGTDPTDNCADDSGDDANPSDKDRDTDFDVGDVIALFGGGPPPIINTPALYTPRSDFDQDRDVDVGDVIIGFGGTPPRINTKCEKTLTFTNNSASAVDEIRIQFTSKTVVYKSSYTATDSCGGTGGAAYTETPGAGSSAHKLTANRSGADAITAACVISIISNNRRPPVARCWDFYNAAGSLVTGASSNPCSLPGSPFDGLHIIWTLPTNWTAALGAPSVGTGDAPPPFACPPFLPLSLNIRGAAAITDYWLTFNFCDVGAPGVIFVWRFPWIGNPPMSIDLGDNGVWAAFWPLSLPFAEDPPPFAIAPGVCGAAQAGGDGFDNEPDGWPDDGCPSGVAGYGGLPGEPDNCFDNNDDDADGSVNDGCPAKRGAAEVVCGPPVDNDLDGWINDGCLTAGPDGPDTDLKPDPEWDQCRQAGINGIDDDGDTLVDEDPVNGNDDDGDTLTDEDGPAIDDEPDGDINDGCLPVAALKP